MSTTACIGPGFGMAGSVTLVTVPLPPVVSGKGMPSDPLEALLQFHMHDWSPWKYGGAPPWHESPGVIACVGSPPKRHVGAGARRGAAQADERCERDGPRRCHAPSPDRLPPHRSPAVLRRPPSTHMLRPLVAAPAWSRSIREASIMHRPAGARAHPASDGAGASRAASPAPSADQGITKTSGSGPIRSPASSASIAAISRVQVEVEHVEVLADALRHDRFRDHDVADLQMPADDDLGRRLAVRLRDLGDRGLVEDRALGERAPCLGGDASSACSARSSRCCRRG